MIEPQLAGVEKQMRLILKTAGPEVHTVGDYIFNGTGKRIRPALLLLAATRPGFDLDRLIGAATAFELMHTASLLHDDVIDGALIRRGKDSVHVRWGNKVSVLAGDYFLSRCFEMLVSYRSWRLMDMVVDIVRDMSEGEVEQAFCHEPSLGLEERYFNWIGKKSASLFAGCCRAGSLLANSGEEEQKHWARFGYNLGMAFQLIDDMLDYTGENSSTGKPRFGDLGNRVVTLPLIRAYDSLPDKGVLEAYFSGAGGEEALREAARAVLASDGPGYTYCKAEDYSRQALKALLSLGQLENGKSELLKQLAYDVLVRER